MYIDISLICDDKENCPFCTDDCRWYYKNIEKALNQAAKKRQAEIFINKKHKLFI